MRGDKYRFRISDSYTPQDLPLARLAQYLDALAGLLGEKEHVHFRAIRKGSTTIVAEVDRPATPKVRERVQSAAIPEIPRDLANSKKKIDDLLAQDNARGRLYVEAEGLPPRILLEFRGRTGGEPVIVSEQHELQGKLVRIGGVADDGATAQIGISSTQTVTVTLRPSLAKEMAAHLYDWIKVSGIGRWKRPPEGQWEFIGFRANEYEVISDRSIRDVLNDSAGVLISHWADSDDPYRELEGIRYGDE